MCEPTTLAVASLAATVIGGGITAYGQMQAGAAAKQQNSYQAAIAENNAEIQRRNADLARVNAGYAEQAGVRQEQNEIRRTRGMIGAQVASQAKNGLITTEGSALDLREDTARLGRVSMGDIRDNSARQASGYRIQGLNADSATTEALTRQQMYLAAGENASSAASLSASGTIIGTGSSTYDRYSDMKRNGVSFSGLSLWG